MTTTKKKAVLAIIMASIVLLVAFPQYGLAASSNSNANEQPQTTASTASSFTLTASPTKLYAVVGEWETSKITVSRFTGKLDLEVGDVSGIITKIEPKSLNLKSEIGYAILSVKIQPKFDLKSVNVTVKASSASIEKIVKVNVTVLNPDFKISANPSTLYLKGMPVETGTSTITLSSVDRFNGTIKLSASTPAGWTAPVLDKNELTLTYPAKSTAKLSIAPPAGAKPGKYVVTVTGEYRNHGESDDITHAVNVTVQVINPDFKVIASPSTMYLLKETSQNSIIRVYSVDRFNGSVELSLAEIVHPDGGSLTRALNPSTALEVLYNKVGSSTLSITVPPSPEFGKYVIEVTAKDTKTSAEHKVNVTVNVINPDFAIYSSASLLSIQAGKSANATLRAISLGRLNDTVALTVLNKPSGWTTTIYTSALKVAYNQSSTTVVTISVPAGTESGKYFVEFKGQGTINNLLTDTTSIKIVVP